MSILKLEGEVDRDMAALFVEQLAQVTQDDLPFTVDLAEADLEDGTACVAMVDALRQTAARLGGLQILQPPQVLAHCLYRVGALTQGGPIHLVSPREELGTSS